MTAMLTYHFPTPPISPLDRYHTHITAYYTLLSIHSVSLTIHSVIQYLNVTVHMFIWLFTATFSLSIDELHVHST